MKKQTSITFLLDKDLACNTHKHSFSLISLKSCSHRFTALFCVNFALKTTKAIS